ncbi:tyrosine-type recombinase/integrase [Comamonas sp. NoAH]|uniref:tyrosine-type recombinase/integrase n=1 Tax=Comamonas halotolerans TaxID=3041496 RepID=UPI0024E04425|nr:tyrosine-type recombinase/integrase [Comamonas sp. NoAH]
MPRAVPIHPRVAHIVRNAALWPIRPTKWTVSKAFKAGARAAGYEHARLHDLRHSTASEMINAGVDLYTVGGVLGHKSAISTKRYRHLATKTLQNAVALVGKKTAQHPKEKPLKSGCDYKNVSKEKAPCIATRGCNLWWVLRDSNPRPTD